MNNLSLNGSLNNEKATIAIMQYYNTTLPHLKDIVMSYQKKNFKTFFFVNAIYQA